MAQAYGFMTGDGGGQKSTDNNNVEWQKQQWDDYLKAISVPSGMNPYPQGQQAQNYTQQTWGSPTWLGGFDWTKPQMAETATKYAAAVVPVQQMYQNAYQYGQDFNEAQRRFNVQQAWQMAGDTYNMNLSQRQQQMAEWQAQEAARQWLTQFDYQKVRDQAEQQLALQQIWGRAQAPNVRWMRNW